MESQIDQMKPVYIVVFLFQSLSACSQQKVEIVKKCRFDGNQSFPSRDVICQRIYIEGGVPVSKVEYAENGWQVIDSLVFERTEKEICCISYNPQYSLKTRKIEKYERVGRNCKEEGGLIKPLKDIEDEYGLTREYVKDLQFLLNQDPTQSNSVFQFEEGITPSLLAQYGIPFDELLYSFSFMINDNLIKKDAFYFKNYILTREYKYDKKRLLEVQVIVNDKRYKTMSKFKEYFAIP